MLVQPRLSLISVLMSRRIKHTPSNSSAVMTRSEDVHALLRHAAAHGSAPQGDHTVPSAIAEAVLGGVFEAAVPARSNRAPFPPITSSGTNDQQSCAYCGKALCAIRNGRLLLQSHRLACCHHVHMACRFHAPMRCLFCECSTYLSKPASVTDRTP